MTSSFAYDRIVHLQHHTSIIFDHGNVFINKPSSVKERWEKSIIYM